MSREIKFRIWLDGELTYLPKMIREVRSIGFCTDDEFYVDINESHEEDSQVMQYTGLKDKNGVEIYEGDICAVENSMLPQQVVYMGEAGYPAFDFEPGWEDDLNHISREWHEGTLEVIGNIYENPELLEVENE